MSNPKVTEVKTVSMILAPADAGPICSYSPYCSPSKRNLQAWRQAVLTMTETDLPPNQDRQYIQQWILQLVRRELTASLSQAESEIGALQLPVTDDAAEIISRALELRAQNCLLD